MSTSLAPATYTRLLQWINNATDRLALVSSSTMHGCTAINRDHLLSVPTRIQMKGGLVDSRYFHRCPIPPQQACRQVLGACSTVLAIMGGTWWPSRCDVSWRDLGRLGLLDGFCVLPFLRHDVQVALTGQEVVWHIVGREQRLAE